MKNEGMDQERDAVLEQVSAAIGGTDREVIAGAVRTSLKWFASLHPGRAVELRVPPFMVVQVLGGTTHRRGTPPAVVEMSPQIWLGLLTGETDWAGAVANGSITASGERSDLSEYFPIRD